MKKKLTSTYHLSSGYTEDETCDKKIKQRD